MGLLEFARPDVVTVPPSASVADAARLMADINVGSVVVVEGLRPVGVLTDRDITVRVVAEGLDPEATPVRRVMTPDPVTLGEELSLFEALEEVKDKAIRRFPVVDPEGRLVGIFTLDDVLHLLGLEMAAVARIIGG
ncbi:CBS domain-containing protein [Marinithermus hydrothermalis]|uniref:Signal transduction protein with CBS domains n=1 Tax=Marinithermus hydrothermalis (strain DSM 14884 / JCM 11576 / T1) TaxID=869210 RepID=F2NPW0_MARHT|nr:CBS domain-containing protein [Marinithermus hydrothermalis]AEB12886.1 putative signal transduction protein with CBS domains [Marinithermus hydrothermalis DSM 14884]